METVGHVVPILTSLGSTETGPSALSVTEKACAAGRRRHSQSWRRDEARSQRRQARGAAEKPEHHAGLLAPARAYRGGVRRGGLLQARRCAEVLRRERSRTRLRVRRPGRGGLQARDRHLGQRRPAAAEVHRAFRALRDRPRRRRPRPRRRRGAGRPEFDLPRLAGLRPSRSDAEMLAHPKVRDLLRPARDASTRGRVAVRGASPGSC